VTATGGLVSADPVIAALVAPLTGRWRRSGTMTPTAPTARPDRARRKWGP